jgi:hypothetical protein
MEKGHVVYYCTRREQEAKDLKKSTVTGNVSEKAYIFTQLILL